MAQNISLLGASYPDVPSVTLPKTGGGTASFTDVSDTTAVAADVASGKLFYDALGVLTAGTASGGLEYEEGTYIPASDIAKPTISFSKTHEKLPIFAIFVDADGYLSTTDTNVMWCYYNFEQLSGPIYETTTGKIYGYARYTYRTGTSRFNQSGVSILSSSESESSDSSTAKPRYHVTESAMYPYAATNGRYWRAGRSYKWIAVWM